MTKIPQKQRKIERKYWNQENSTNINGRAGNFKQLKLERSTQNYASQVEFRQDRQLKVLA